MPLGTKVRAAAILLMLPAGFALPAAFTGLTPEKLREAIRWGLTAPEPDLAQYEMKTDRTWLVNFDTPFLRVAQLSRAMKIQNTPVTEADVSPKTAADEVHIYAHARPDGAIGRGASLRNIDFMFIAHPREGGTDTIQPLSVQSFLRRVPMGDDWDGPTRISRSVKAVFPLPALAAGNEVRLVFEGGEVQSVKITAELLAHVR